MEPGWAGNQGSEANTFTQENSWGQGLSIIKGAAPPILTLKVVEEPVQSCDTTMVDHWPTGGAGLMSTPEFLLEPIAVFTCRPLLGWKKMPGILSPSFAQSAPFVICRIDVQPVKL